MNQPSMTWVPETLTWEEEFDGIVRDLRAKQHSAAAYQNSAPLHTVDEQTKIKLAQRASRVTLPGVAVEQSNNANRSSKPSAFQLEEMGNWRRVQKNRRAEQNREEQLPEPVADDEEKTLDEFQSRMVSFQNSENQRIKRENEATRKQKTERMKRMKRFMLDAMQVVAIVVVGTVISAIVVLIGGSSRRGVEGADLAEPSTFHDCYMRNDSCYSDRFVQLRKVVSSEWSWGVGPGLSDSAGSSHRAALCWLADVDSFELEIDNGTEYEVVQRFALAAIYYHFVLGVQGLSGLKFLDHVHVCGWGYVACDGPNTRITELYLDSLQLSKKQIPEEVALLSDLVYLKLTRSFLTGRIPSALSRLAQLQVLDLSLNVLTGDIPTEMGLLMELRELHLNGNHLEGEIPRHLFKLPHLHELVSTHNFLTGILPATFSNATGLTRFSIEGNSLNGTIPDISRLRNLKYLGMGKNVHIRDSFPDISRLSDLGEWKQIRPWLRS